MRSHEMKTCGVSAAVGGCRISVAVGVVISMNYSCGEDMNMETYTYTEEYEDTKLLTRVFTGKRSATDKQRQDSHKKISNYAAKTPTKTQD